MSDRDTRRRCPDRRRRSGGAVGRAAAGAAAEGAGRRAALDRGPRERRARPARTCCRAPSSIRRALRDLIPDFERTGAPLASAVHHDAVYFLTRTGKIKLPITPPPLRNHGNYIISLNRFVKWLAGLVEAEGHRHLHRVSRRPNCCSTANAWSASAPAIAASASTASGRRRSSRRRHPRQGHDLRRRRARQPDEGARPAARARRWPEPAALCDRHQGAVGGSRGSTRGRHASSTRWAIRCGMDEFGGGFIYAMPDGALSLGFVAGLDYHDPMFDPHVAFQHFKRHPLVCGAARRRTDGALRREGAAGRRLAHDSETVRGRRADRRRCRRAS